MSNSQTLPTPTDLRLARRLRRLSLADVGRALDLDPTLLSRIERGQRPLPPVLALRLIEFLYPPKAPGGAA